MCDGPAPSEGERRSDGNRLSRSALVAGNVGRRTPKVDDQINMIVGVAMRDNAPQMVGTRGRDGFA